jgi:hypothetical protein
METSERQSCHRRKPDEIRSSYQLIVEGKDDKTFFEAFLENLGLSGVQIYSLDGKNNLNDFLKAFTLTTGYNTVKAIGIIRDSNSDPKASFQSVRTALANAGLPVPEKEIISAGEKPRVSILMIPGIDESGSLEALCLRAVADRPAISCVESYIDCLERNNLKLQPNIYKAKLQAYLASLDEYTRDLGLAAKKSVWPFTSPAFNRIRDFLTRIVLD